MIFQASVAELKKMNASDLNEGDVIFTPNHIINIQYGDYKRPSLLSYVENRKTFKKLNCTPGVRGGWPYYIADFLGK